VAALVVAGYLLTRFDVSLPVINPTYDVQAVIVNAGGLDPSNRPAVVAGGVRIGRVTRVHFSPSIGRTVVTLQLSDSSRGRLFADASIRIVPRSALQDLVVDIDPGTPAAGPLAPGQQIIAEASAAPVGYDRVLGVLDADTQAYTQILAGTLRELLRGRAGALRQALDTIPALDTPATHLAEELAGRRRDLSALVAELSTITAATGRRGSELGRAVVEARATLSVTATRQAEIERAFQELPATLGGARNAFGAVARLAVPLTPALAALRPAARALPTALQATRRLVPVAHGLITDAQPVVTAGRQPLADLHQALDELGPAAQAISPLLPTLLHLIASMNDNRNFILDLLGNWPGTISVAGNTGVEARTLFLGMENLRPALFGIESAQQQARLASSLRTLRARRPSLFGPSAGSEPGSPLSQAVRALLINTCHKTNPWACAAVMTLDQQRDQRRRTR
jgi:ABC-type transporter Mla subunit MlaD